MPRPTQPTGIFDTRLNSIVSGACEKMVAEMHISGEHNDCGVEVVCAQIGARRVAVAINIYFF